MFRDLYADFERAVVDPRDVTHEGEPELEADALAYRLGFRAGWVGELPDDLQINRVAIAQIVGPVLTQRTELRQQPGPRLTWDKRMIRGVEVGAGQWMTIFQIRSGIVRDVAAAMPRWRQEALAAAGALAAILDERVALEELLEDVLFLRGDEVVAAADMASSVRPHLPYRVTDVERRALDLAQINGIPDSVAAGLRWYVRAMQGGPSADGVVLFWIALETLSTARSTSPKAIEADLAQMGWNVESLPISVGRLAGLRAAIVHAGDESDPLIYDGYYVLEAISRAILRDRLGIWSSWPAAVAANLFEEPWRRQIERSWASPQIRWCEDGLPAPHVSDEVLRLTWGTEETPPPTPNQEPVVVVEGSDDEPWRRRVIHWVATAARAMALPDDPIRVLIVAGSPAEVGVNATHIKIDEVLLRNPDPLRELRLAWLLHGVVIQHHLMARGVPSDGRLGSLLLELASAWCRHREFVGPDGPLDDADLTLTSPSGDDYFALGGHIGAAAAGSQRSVVALEEWRATRPSDDELSEIVFALLGAFAQAGAPHEIAEGVMAFLHADGD